jgi:hypothetical protein
LRIANDDSGHASVLEIMGVIDDVPGSADVETWPAEFPINQARQNHFTGAIRTSQNARDLGRPSAVS